MIEWKFVEAWGYYADAGRTLIDEFFIDRSRAPKLWRLRHGRRGGDEFIVMRIKKGTLIGLQNMSSIDIQILSAAGIESAAKSIGLTPCGKPRSLKVADLWTTNLGQP